MPSLLQRSLQATPFYYPLQTWLERRRQRRDVADWERSGRTTPPPHLHKQAVLRACARRHGLRTLVETGTYRGEMVQAMRHDFDAIFSIELSDVLHERARRRFATASHVRLIQGDSGRQLASLVPRLDRPALFWLDGHYSAGITAKGDQDTPILDELRHIVAAGRSGHVILIDDARLFGTDAAYPTIEQIRDFLTSHGVGNDLVVADDIVRIGPL